MPKKEVKQIVCPLCLQEMRVEKRQFIFECFEGKIHSFTTDTQTSPLAKKVAELDCQIAHQLILS
ncbi:MAG: hypothetical protein V1892_02155 [bacterium]